MGSLPLSVSCVLVLSLLAAPHAMAESFPTALVPIDFTDMSGWQQDDHAAALTAFVVGCSRPKPASTKPSGVSGERLAELCAVAADVVPSEARAFFEQNFRPHQIDGAGLLTGYFEPQVLASFERTEEYRYPLYARPADLVELVGPAQHHGINDDVTWGRSTDTGFEAFPDREAIMGGALDGQGLELVYLKSSIDVFFIHIQGSARLAMTDGSVQRVNFAGKSGHAYTPIGRTLIERGDMALEDITMDRLRAWLASASPQDRDAVLATNRSYIFFAMQSDFDPTVGPVAAAGVPLTPGRSLAIDRHLHTFGTPIFVESGVPLPGDDTPLNRLMIAQDTGSAIVGPARGDIFIGSGDEAGSVAGAVNQAVSFVLLMPTPAESPRDEPTQ